MKRSRGSLKPSTIAAPFVGSYKMVYMNEGSDLLKAYLAKVNSIRRQRGGDKVKGQIMERRLLKSRESTGSLTSIADEELTAMDYEYYIHFYDFESRLDQWVLPDRIDFLSVVDSPSPKKSKHDYSTNFNGKQGSGPLAGCDGLSESQLTPHAHLPKNVSYIHLGEEWKSEAWYHSPYRDEDINKKDQCIYLCSWCLKPFSKAKSVGLHSCGLRHPPGGKIYQDTDNAIEVYEINGAHTNHKAYCQHVSLLAKLFLEHKSVHYNCETFLFYVLCEVDAVGSRIVGYFSREKHSLMHYNLACLLVLPPHQKKGYGKFLISLSYELSKRRNNFRASPEKPLSDLAQICYRRYWTYMIVKTFLRRFHMTGDHGCTLQHLVEATGICIHDLAATINEQFPVWEAKDRSIGGNGTTSAAASAGIATAGASDINIRISRHTFNTFGKNLAWMKTCKPECMVDGK